MAGKLFGLSWASAGAQCKAEAGDRECLIKTSELGLSSGVAEDLGWQAGHRKQEIPLCFWQAGRSFWARAGKLKGEAPFVGWLVHC